MPWHKAATPLRMHTAPLPHALPAQPGAATPPWGLALHTPHTQQPCGSHFSTLVHPMESSLLPAHHGDTTTMRYHSCTVITPANYGATTPAHVESSLLPAHHGDTTPAHIGSSLLHTGVITPACPPWRYYSCTRGVITPANRASIPLLQTTPSPGATTLAPNGANTLAHNGANTPAHNGANTPAHNGANTPAPTINCSCPLWSYQFCTL